MKLSGNLKLSGDFKIRGWSPPQESFITWWLDPNSVGSQPVETWRSKYDNFSPTQPNFGLRPNFNNEGKYLIFDGIDDALTQASNQFSHPSGATKFTIAFWANPDIVDANKVIIETANYPNEIMALGANGTLDILVGVGRVQFPRSMTLDTWVLYVMTYDGSRAFGSRGRLYRGANPSEIEQITPLSDTISETAVPAATGTALIGGRSTVYYDGKLSHAVLWNGVELSLSEIKDFASMTMPSNELTPPKLNNMVLWMDSQFGITESGGLVDAWRSKVGTAVFTAAGAARPALYADGLRFDGTDDVLSRTADAQSQNAGSSVATLLIWNWHENISLPEWTFGTSNVFGNGFISAPSNVTPFPAVYLGTGFTRGPDNALIQGDYRCTVLTFDGAQSLGNRGKIYYGINPVDITTVDNIAVTTVPAVSGSSVIGGIATRYALGRIASIGLWSAILTPEEILLAARALRPPTVTNYICDGNSLTQGIGGTPYPTQLQSAVVSGSVITNIGVSGQTTAQMISDFASQVPPLRKETCYNVYIAWEVRNAMYFGASPRAAVNDLWTLVGLANAAGFEPRVCTVIASMETGSLTNIKIAEANQYIRNEYLLNRAILIDLAADPRLSDENDTAFFDVDKIHLNTNGYAAVVDIIQKRPPKFSNMIMWMDPTSKVSISEPNNSVDSWTSRVGSAEFISSGLDRPSLVGDYLDFDGSSTYLYRGADASSHPGSATLVTVGMWIYADEATTALRAPFATAPDGTGLWWQVRKSINVQYAFVGSGAAVATTTNFTENGWRFIAWTFNGSLAAGSRTIQYYGESEDISTVPGSDSTPASVAGPTGLSTIGKDASHNRFWDGKIGHIGMWNGSVLSLKELKAFALLTKPVSNPPQFSKMIMWMDPTLNISSLNNLVDSWSSRVGGAVFSATSSGKPVVGTGYIEFDGVDDFLSRTADANSHPAGFTSCTLALWEWRDVVDANLRTPFASSNENSGLEISGNNAIKTFNVAFRAALTPATPVVAGAWIFRAFTYSPAALTAYEGTSPSTVAVVTSTAGNAAVAGFNGQSRIGSTSPAFPRHFDGRIGHIGMWAGAELTLTELKEFASISRPFPPQYLNMIMWMDPTKGITESGNLVSNWRSRVGNAEFTASGAERPTLGNGSLIFDGVANTLIRTADAHSHPGGAAKSTLCMWIKRDTTSSLEIWMSSVPFGVGGFLIQDGSTTRQYYVTGGTFDSIASATNYTGWKFRAVTFNGSIASGTRVRVYEGDSPDKIVEISTTDTGADTVMTAASGQSRIGSDSGLNRWANGDIGHIGMWSGIDLSLAELREFATLTSPNGFIPYRENLLWWLDPRRITATPVDTWPARIGSFSPTAIGAARPIWDGTSAEFNGSSNVLTQTASAAIHPAGATKFTIGMWIRPDAVAVANILSTGTYPNEILLQFNGTFNIFVGTTAAATATLTIGIWQFVAFTFDGSRALGDRCRAYVGAPTLAAVTLTSDNVPAVVPSTAGTAFIGAYTFYYDGKIGDILLWSGVELTLQELQNVADATNY